MTDEWEPWEKGWKAYLAEHPSRAALPFHQAILETDCPNCGDHVDALIKDGPDPVFADVECPRETCRHEWSERCF